MNYSLGEGVRNIDITIIVSNIIVLSLYQLYYACIWLKLLLSINSKYKYEMRLVFCITASLLGMRINFPNNYKCIIEGKIKREISFKKGQLEELVG